MAKNYQITHKLHSKSIANLSTNIYVATYLPNRDSVTLKITDLEELNDIQLILNEIFYAKNLRHVNILPILNCFAHNSQLWCVYPFIYFGSCRDILDSINNYYMYNTQENNTNQLDTLIDRADEQKRLCFNEQSLQPITKSILNALDYLHSKHIIHRCICPDNIYITHTGHVYLGGLNYSISLINQGCLKRKLHDFPANFKDYLNYVSPEILQQNLIGYNIKSDVYSLGVTLCELANGVNPFIGCEKAQMFHEKLVGYDIGLWDRNILTPESKNLFVSVYATENPKVIASVQRRFFSDKFRNFVDLCVQRNYELRPATTDLQQHAYLKKMKLQTCLPTFQMSIIAEGLIDLQSKCDKLNVTLQDSTNGKVQLDASGSFNSQQVDSNNNKNKPTLTSSSSSSWNF